MKGLIQRVRSADVRVAGDVVGAIEQGLLLLLGVEKHDDDAVMRKLLHRVLTYRVFPDDDGRMNRSLLDIRGNLLVVPQFTLAADTRKGTRASFTSAASPETAETLYGQFLELARQYAGLDARGLNHVAGGVFGADMQLSLVNDGPVTFLLEA